MNRPSASAARSALAVLVVVVAVGVGACSGGDDGGVSTGPSRSSSSSRGSPSDAPAASSYVGLSKQAAIARAEGAGVPWRITREDDEVFLVTQDYVPDRVNFEIDDGTVTKTTRG